MTSYMRAPFQPPAPEGSPSPAEGRVKAGSPPDASPVPLLWTGGWDSTFQLLRLLLDYRRPVAPFYLVDDTRASTRAEMNAMDRIRARLAEEYPATRALLLPTRTARVAELAPDAEIEGAFDRILRRAFLGGQYAWLARFSRQQGIEGMELSVENTTHGAHAVLARFMEPVRGADGYLTYRFSPHYRDTDEYRVFGAFSFPLFDTTKLDMAATVEARGWKTLMAMTWFCHRPRADQPCGCCNPCLYAVEQGFGWRIPPRRRALGAVYRITVKPAKQVAKKALRPFRSDARWSPTGA